MDEIKTLLDYLTPEERAAYSKKIAPTTGQRLGALGSGFADAITSVGLRPTNFMGNYQNQMGQNMEKAEKEMYGVAADRRKSMEDYLSKKKAEKERLSFEGLASKYLPEFAGTEIGIEPGKDIFKTVYGGQLAQKRAEQSKEMENKRLGRLFRNDEENAKERIIAKINSDKAIKDNYTMYQNTGRVQSILKMGNPIGDKTVSNFMTRASGEVGALTEADKAPFGGSMAFNARWKQALQNWKTGTFTDENRAFLSDLANALGQKAQQNMAERANLMSRQYGQIRNFTPEQIVGLVGYEDVKASEAPVTGTVKMKDASGNIYDVPVDEVENAESDPDDPLMRVE